MPSYRQGFLNGIAEGRRESAAEIERLRAALKPFAKIGRSRWISIDAIAALSPKQFHAAAHAVADEQSTSGSDKP